MLQFLLSILLSGALLLGNAEAATKATRQLANRLFGEQGPEFQELIAATVRSVTFGILGVALIQSAFAAAGFFLFGLPGAHIWTFVFVIGAVLQMGGLVLIPAVVYSFAVASTTKAIMFLIWCVFVGVMDNVLKPPSFLGRGASIPIAVIFIGVLGGFVAMGIVGLFVGANACLPSATSYSWPDQRPPRQSSRRSSGQPQPRAAKGVHLTPPKTIWAALSEPPISL